MRQRLTLLIILLVAGALSFFFIEKEEKLSGEPNDIASSTTLVAPTNDEQIDKSDFILSEGSIETRVRYTNTSFDFLLEYPSEYQPIPKPSSPAYNGDVERLSDLTIVAPANNDFVSRGISISVLPIEGYSFRDIPGGNFFFKFDLASQSCLIDDYDLKDSPKGKIVVSGELFGCRIASGDGLGVLKGVFIPLSEKRVVVQVYFYGSLRDGADGFVDAEIDEIIRTFRLAD